jgi:putative endonuclease
LREGSRAIIKNLNKKGGDMSYYFYIIESIEKGKRYYGHAEDVQKRLDGHNSGKTKSTRKNRPYKLIHVEEYKTKREAIKREIQVKKMKGGIQLKKLLNNNGE